MSSTARGQCSLVVTNTNDSGVGSLRDAINCANGMEGPVTITFNIPGAGVHVISPTSDLPDILTTLTLDGYSQPGAAVNTLASGDNASIKIQLDGSQIGDDSGVSRERRAARRPSRAQPSRGRTPKSLQQFDDGIFIEADNVVIKGLSIVNFTGYGIYADLDDAVIQGCFIGVAADGFTAGPNFAGIGCWFGTQIGGTNPADRNILSGNFDVGIEVDGEECVVQGNLIGTDATGLGNLGNGDDGVQVFNWFNEIGGVGPGVANVIAFNDGAGVDVLCGESATVTGERARKGAGEECAFGCTIGVAILGNSIFSNTGVGISLGDSPVPNDDCDEDSGPNGLQNYPVLTKAEVITGGTQIQGTLNTSPFGTYRVELFASPACDPSGFGEGRTFIGATSVSTGDGCDTSFNVTVPSVLSAGEVVTATATDECGDTSEFSACLPVTGAVCLKPSPPGDLLIDSTIVQQGSFSMLTWVPPARYSGGYDVLYSTDNGATFSTLAAGIFNDPYVFQVTFPVGTTVILEVLADEGCGPGGISDPSPTVSLLVVAACPPVADPVAQVAPQIIVGSLWTLQWSSTLPDGPSGPGGIYIVQFSSDGGKSFQTLGTTAATSFQGGPVSQADIGKTFFLHVLAKPSCAVGAGIGVSNVVSFTVVESIIGCSPPEAAVDPLISVLGPDNQPLSRPPFPTEPLTLTWEAPSGGSTPTAYLYRINGDAGTRVTGTTVTAPPRGSKDPITLYVTTVSCSEPELFGPTAQSPTVALMTSPPGANFSISPDPRVGQPVTFTDTSDPQATSWLWLFDDGSQQTVQSPSKTFTTPGSHTVALIATNGAGSATSVQSFLVASSEATAVAASSTDIAFTAAGAGRRRTFVNVAGLGVVRLELSSSAGSDTTLFLRFLDGGGRLLIERRLVVPAGHMAAYDLGAFGLRGTFNIELVGDTAVGATIVQTGRSTTEVSR